MVPLGGAFCARPSPTNARLNYVTVIGLKDFRIRVTDRMRRHFRSRRRRGWGVNRRINPPTELSIIRGYTGRICGGSGLKSLSAVSQEYLVIVTLCTGEKTLSPPPMPLYLRD